MRYINLEDLEVDDNWKNKAQKAFEEVCTKTDEKERSEYINSKSTIWSNLKPELEHLSNKKCWYCEARETRTDRAVDHYRPKNNVRDSNPSHSGYWWLAFDHTNYRLSCTFCNERRGDRETGEMGGKWDYFPLEDETKRVCNRGTKLRNEMPLLLDPCRRSDVALLWYADDGRVVPKFDKAKKPLAFKRAATSIERYNLNERDIKEARQILYKRLRNLIKRGDRHFENSFNGVIDADDALADVIQDIEELLNKDSEFSEFAKATIAGFRGAGREWMDTI